MGTSAVEDPEMLKSFCRVYPNRVVLGIDALDGYVKTQGWLKGSDLTPIQLVKSLKISLLHPLSSRIFRKTE